ncbi:MAG: hypothetical protein JF612_12190, partial [Planctomycetia bacterium]|nr:hypothetical protein [Planctomycetia bacterium]
MLRHHLVSFGVRVTIVCLCLSSVARAQATSDAPAPAPTPTSMLRRPAWPAVLPLELTVSPLQGVATLAAGLDSGAFALVGPAQPARWEAGGILFSAAARRSLRLEPEKGQSTAGWLARSDDKAAIDLELAAIEAFSYSGLGS